MTATDALQVFERLASPLATNAEVAGTKAICVLRTMFSNGDIPLELTKQVVDILNLHASPEAT